jgi:hypothetical protein
MQRQVKAGLFEGLARFLRAQAAQEAQSKAGIGRTAQYFRMASIAAVRHEGLPCNGRARYLAPPGCCNFLMVKDFLQRPHGSAVFLASRFRPL